MSSCTIYIRHTSPASCVGNILERSVAASVEVNPLVREKPGDYFSRLILGTHNFARRRVKGREDQCGPVLDFIASTSVIVGVPHSPDTRVLAALTVGMKAVIFDGQTIRDPEGKDLLA